ncbi:MAG TPA: tetratricopeptide repeat protein [Vicinamibacteria bacterium]|nr:tetratricopeptide repeat protein [Vicinamibacteria bacterium]
MNKWLALAIAFVIGSGVALAQQEQPGAQDFLAGQEAVKAKNYDAAITAFEKALAANPDLFASNYFLGFAYKTKQNWEKCGTNFDTFLKKVGSDPKAAEQIGHSNREGGLCYARAESTAKAIPMLQKAASAKPDDKEVQFLLGVALMRENRENEAETAFTKVIQLDPSLQRAYYYAGRINFNRQEWDQATQRLEKYLELGATDAFAPDAHFMVGSNAIRQAEGSPDAAALQQKASDHLTKFLAAKPTAPQAAQAHYILGSLAAQRDDNETAKTHFQKYLELEPNGAQAEEVKKFLQDLTAQ